MLTAESVRVERVSCSEVLDSLKCGKSDLLTEVLGGRECEDLCAVFGAIILSSSSSSLPAAAAKSALSCLKIKMRHMRLQHLLEMVRAFAERLAKADKLRSDAFDLLVSAFAVLKHSDARVRLQSGDDEALSAHQLANIIAFKLVNSIVDVDNIVPLIVALREADLTFGDELYRVMLKKMENIPIVKMPAAMYQFLLWCRGAGCLTSCFESIFAILETQHERLEVGSCVSHIKLAFLHDKLVSLAFIKYAKDSLKSGGEVSPFLLLLLLGASTGPDLAMKLIESYFAFRSTVSSKLASFPDPIPGVDSKIWSGSERLIKKLIDILQRDDEASIMALIGLGLRILFRRSGEKRDLQLQHWGGLLLSELFKKFEVTRSDILYRLLSMAEESPELAAITHDMIDRLCHVDHGTSLASLLLQQQDSIFLDSLVQSVSSNDQYYPAFCRILVETCWRSSFSTSAVFSLCGLCGEERLEAALYSAIMETAVNESNAQLLHKVLSKHWGPDHGASEPILAYLYHQFTRCCLGENYTDWKVILNNCVAEEGLIIQHLPIIIALLIESLQEEEGSGESAMVRGVLNNLCETLCSEIHWLSVEKSLGCQARLRPMILALYDCGVMFCLRSRDLSDKAKLDACCKIAQQKSKFESQFSAEHGQVPILGFVDLERFMALLSGTKEFPGLEGALGYLASVPAQNYRHASGNSLLTSVGGLMSMVLEDSSQISAAKRRVQSGLFNKLVLASTHCVWNLSSVASLCSCLQRVLSSEASAKEIAALADLVSMAVQALQGNQSADALLSGVLESIRTWPCGGESETVAAKAVCRLALRLQGPPVKPTLLAVCKDIVTVLGRLEEETPEERRPLHAVKYKFCTTKSIESITACTLAHIREQLDELGWIHDIATIVCRYSTSQGILTVSHICAQTQPVVQTVAMLAEASITGANFHRLVETLLALLKLASAVSKTMSAFKLPLREEFIKLAEAISGDLTRNIYAMLPAVQQVELDRYREQLAVKKKKTVTQKYRVQITKESRLIPLLIFQIEAFERSLLALNSLHKTIICKTLHRSTARDFRIQLDELEAALEQMEAERDGQKAPRGDLKTDSAEPEETEMSLIISNGLDQPDEDAE